MSGSYHGGDGWTMIERVDKLLKDTPAIYLGEEPFDKARTLAKKISSGRGLASAVKALEAQRESAEDETLKAELDRMHAAVVRYRDRAIERAEGFVGTKPKRVVSRLKSLHKQLKGTSLGADVEAKIESWSASEDLETAIGIQKKFEKIVRSFEKLKESKRTDAVVERTVKKLEALIEGRESLPIAATVEAYLADLR
jgi:hypothetical protein